MALTDESGGMATTMLVQPSGVNGNGGFGFGDGNGFWILLLFLLLGNGGWGGGFGGGFDGGLYPWMNNSQNISSGFRDQMLNDNVTSIRDGVYGITNQLCNGFAGVNAGIVGAQNALTQQMYTNQISDLERSFAAQTANTAGLTGLQSQLANCCCENKASIADLKFTVATEACASRKSTTLKHRTWRSRIRSICRISPLLRPLRLPLLLRTTRCRLSTSSIVLHLTPCRVIAWRIQTPRRRKGVLS